MWCKYFDPPPRYSQKAKFKMAAADGWFLLPVPVSIIRPPPGSHNAAAHQISSKSSIALLSYCDWANFQDGRRLLYWISTFACWPHTNVQRRCQNLTLVRTEFLQFNCRFVGEIPIAAHFWVVWGAKPLEDATLNQTHKSLFSRVLGPLVQIHLQVFALQKEKIQKSQSRREVIFHSFAGNSPLDQIRWKLLG